MVSKLIMESLQRHRIEREPSKATTSTSDIVSKLMKAHMTKASKQMKKQHSEPKTKHEHGPPELHTASKLPQAHKSNPTTVTNQIRRWNSTSYCTFEWCELFRADFAPNVCRRRLQLKEPAKINRRRQTRQLRPRKHPLGTRRSQQQGEGQKFKLNGLPCDSYGWQNLVVVKYDLLKYALATFENARNRQNN